MQKQAEQGHSLFPGPQAFAISHFLTRFHFACWNGCFTQYPLCPPLNPIVCTAIVPVVVGLRVHFMPTRTASRRSFLDNSEVQLPDACRDL
jgi:hypothetical protein